CREPVALNSLYQEIYNPNRTTIMVLGSTCSSVTEITASVANLSGLQQVSYSAVSPLLSSKQLFPNFFRVMTPEQSLTVARVKLFQEMGWTRVHSVYEDQKLFSS
ncbi:gamma-aminobutyric acid type B receptor subunit 1, partial [Biomphalaria pfeifferi]